MFTDIWGGLHTFGSHIADTRASPWTDTFGTWRSWWRRRMLKSGAKTYITSVPDLIYPMIPQWSDTDVSGSTIAYVTTASEPFFIACALVRFQVEFAYDGGPLELSRFGSYERRYQEQQVCLTKDQWIPVQDLHKLRDDTESTYI